MIEILILYVLNKREKTIYSIRKDIIEYFGTFTKPSLGTIHPALKRMLGKNYVNVQDRMSEGGKKSSYYSITDAGKKYFNELFLSEISANPSLFHNQIQSRFATLSMLPDNLKIEFLDEISKKIDMYKFEVVNKINDEFISFDASQKILLQSTLEEISLLKTCIENLRNEHERNNK